MGGVSAWSFFVRQFLWEPRGQSQTSCIITGLHGAIVRSELRQQMTPWGGMDTRYHAPGVLESRGIEWAESVAGR